MDKKASDVLIERDYAKKPLIAEEVEMIFGNDPIPPFLNTRHTVYKEQNLVEKLPDRSEVIRLVLADPNLIRRPTTRLGTSLVIGFDKEALTKLVG